MLEELMSLVWMETDSKAGTPPAIFFDFPVTLLGQILIQSAHLLRGNGGFYHVFVVSYGCLGFGWESSQFCRNIALE